MSPAEPCHFSPPLTLSTTLILYHQRLLHFVATMADLYNLDAELDNYSDHEELDQEDEQEDLEDVEADKHDGNVPVPEVLRQAAQRLKNLPSKPLDQSVEEEEEEDDVDDWQQSGATLKATEQLLLDLSYHRLGKLWAQECHSPELVPFDHDTIATMSEELRSVASGETINDIALQNAVAGNANMQALVESILRIDADRLKFLLADLLKRRLAKIEAHPLHMRTKTDRMSEHEVRYWCQLVGRTYGASRVVAKQNSLTLERALVWWRLCRCRWNF
jgi:hypothetical protein